MELAIDASCCFFAMEVYDDDPARYLKYRQSLNDNALEKEPSRKNAQSRLHYPI